MRGSILAIPFPDDSFDLVISNDVLCDEGAVDDEQALREIYRVLKPGGRVFLNLPAYPWMLSRHDAAVYNVRRYTRRRLARLLQAAGFRLLFASYWNIVMFPIIVLTR